jgi:hypothetical protein
MLESVDVGAFWMWQVDFNNALDLDWPLQLELALPEGSANQMQGQEEKDRFSHSMHGQFFLLASQSQVVVQVTTSQFQGAGRLHFANSAGEKLALLVLGNRLSPSSAHPVMTRSTVFPFMEETPYVLSSAPAMP